VICSGTVLFPRIVVTAAHRIQEKVQFRGGEFYADSYLPPVELTVTVTHHWQQRGSSGCRRGRFSCVARPRGG
jgi:hypothetical protein